MDNTPSKLNSFLCRKDSLSAQIMKYVLSGGLAVAVDVLTFYLLALFLFPCLRETDPVARVVVWLGGSVTAVDPVVLKRNFLIIKGFCFVASNTVVYLLNSRFVFERGRYSRTTEILLFFGSSLFQFIFIWFGRVLISEYGWEVTYSNIAMLATSLMVNFVVRKKIVFKG